MSWNRWAWNPPKRATDVEQTPCFWIARFALWRRCCRSSFFLPLVCSVAWAHHVPSLSPSFAWPVCLSIWFSHHSITFSSDSADNAFDLPMRLNSTRLIIIKWQWWWFFFAIFLFFCVAAAADAILFGSVRFSLAAVFAFSRQYASWMMSLKFVSRTLISISTLYVHKK